MYVCMHTCMYVNSLLFRECSLSLCTCIVLETLRPATSEIQPSAVSFFSAEVNGIIYIAVTICAVEVRGRQTLLVGAKSSDGMNKRSI